MPANEADNVDYFVAKRDEFRRALEAADRDAADFTFAGQVTVATDDTGLRRSRRTALEFLRVGADHIILGVSGSAGPDGVRAMAREVGEPLREAAG